MKRLFNLFLSIAFVLAMTTVTFASDGTITPYDDHDHDVGSFVDVIGGDLDNLKVGSIIKCEDGTIVVYQIDPDGTAYAAAPGLSRAACTHPASMLSPSGVQSTDKSKVNSSAVCYKSRVKAHNKCMQCGATVYTYGAEWTLHDHNYGFFTGRCTNKCDNSGTTCDRKK